MAVNVRIPEALRSLTGGADMVSAEAGNVRELIDALDAKHAGIKERICDESGEVRRFVNIFVADEDIRFQQDLDTPLAPGSEVSILPAIAGGAARKPGKKRAAGEVARRRVYLTFTKDLVTRPSSTNWSRSSTWCPTSAGP
jgi:molybdopterin synthase sulfur carrier subunit